MGMMAEEEKISGSLSRGNSEEGSASWKERIARGNETGGGGTF